MSEKRAGKVSVLVDNDSWILPYAEELTQNLRESCIDARLVRKPEDIQEGWACFLLGCIHIISNNFLKRNKHNLVVHESDLPKGRGFAPMAWQILEGQNSIPVCLVEASADQPDSGDIWLKDSIELEGHEFLPTWRHLQGRKTVELCQNFITEYDALSPRKQTGEPTWYRRRRPRDSELDATKPLEEQINLLRIVDNQRYPAFFKMGETKIFIRVSPDDLSDDSLQPDA